MNPKAELRLYKKLNETSWDSNYSVIILSDLDETEGLEANRDQFRITLDNQKNNLTRTLEVDDRIEIYLYRGDSPTSEDLVIDGLITEINYSLGSGGRKLVIRGANRTQELLGSLVLLTFTDNSKKPYEAIHEVISQVNNNNQASSPNHPRHIFYDSSTVVETKSDGSSFNNNNFIVNYKTAYEAIQQFSGDEYTGDGQYIFWIDSNNYLHWTYKSNQIPSGYTFSDNDGSIEGLEVTKGTWDVYNSIIIDVGRDCNGHGNHALEINTRSIIEAGAKWKFLDRSSITANLINAEFQADTSKWDVGDEGERLDNYPKDSAYPYTMQFEEIDSNGQETGSKWVVFDDNEFNRAIRVRARYEGKKIARNFINKHGELRYKAKIELNGTLDFEKGLLCQLTSKTANLTNQKLRIMEVSHSYNKAGWITTLNLEEDVE